MKGTCSRCGAPAKNVTEYLGKGPPEYLCDKCSIKEETKKEKG